MSVMSVLSVWKRKLTELTKLTEQKMYVRLWDFGTLKSHSLKVSVQIFTIYQTIRLLCCGRDNTRCALLWTYCGCLCYIETFDRSNRLTL